MTLQGRYARHENKEISKLLIGTCCVSLLVVLYQLAIAVPRSELQSTTDGFHHGVAAVPCDPLSTRENLDKFQAGSNKYTSKLDEQSQLSTRSKQTICSLRSMHFATRPTAFGKCKKAKKSTLHEPTIPQMSALCQQQRIHFSHHGLDEGDGQPLTPGHSLELKITLVRP